MKSNRCVVVLIIFCLILSLFYPTIALAGDTKDDVDGNETDVDSSSDKGTETTFTNAQDTGPDGNYMNIQEASFPGGAGSEWLNCNAWNDGFATDWTRVGTPPYLGEQDEPTNYISSKTSGADEGWFDFPSTSLEGTITVNISIYCKNDDGANEDYADVYVDYTGGGEGTDVGNIAQHTTYSYDVISLGTHTASEVNNLRVYFHYVKVKGADDVYIDHVRIGCTSSGITNYMIDFEYDWSNAVYDETNEEVCFYLGGTISEDLNVSYYSSGWNYLGQITSTGWTNLTATGLTSTAYTIRLNGTAEIGDSSQNDWNIDCILLHTWSVENTAPTQAYPCPVNDATGISLFPRLNVTVDDAEDDTLTATWRSNSTGPWVTFAENDSIDTSLGSVNISQDNLNFSKGTTKCFWSVNLTDNNGEWNNITYYFTTEDWLWIDITNTSWSLGTVPMSSSIWTNETGKTFIADMDNCSVNTDLILQITTDAVDWSSAIAGSGPGDNIYRLNASTDMWSTEYQIVTASQATISLDIAAWTNETFDLRFDAPISTNTNIQQTITVTVSLIKH